MANERESAVPLLRELNTRLGDFGRHEIFVVFDRVCRDGTVDLVRELARELRAVRVVWAPENRTVVDAYMRGYREALNSGADWILEFDAGYSHLPAEIPRFIEAMDRGYDCVFGSRFCPGGRMIDPGWKRYLVSRGGSVLTNALIGTRLYDMTSGFQLFRREALERILARGIRSSGPFFQTEMKVHAGGMKVCEVPISYDSTSSSLHANAIGDAFSGLSRLLRDRISGRLGSAAHG